MAFPVLAAIPVVGELLKGVFELIDKVIPDKNAAEKAKQEMTMKTLEMQQQLQTGQIDINKQEAAHASMFVAGWRPAIGWTCALALFWHFVGYEMARWVALMASMNVEVPRLMSGENLMELVLAMLGLAGFRSYEKFKGVASK
jgi:hypothetical protein